MRQISQSTTINQHFKHLYYQILITDNLQLSSAVDLVLLTTFA
jgi:hypothetical protein